MPTGYTAAVQDGTITELAPFAMQCARAFGALVMMRDEPSNAAIPEEFAPSDFHAKALDTAQAKLSALHGMTPAESDAAALAEFTAALEFHMKHEAERLQQKERYTVMLAKVKAWRAPTTDHERLREFMVEQLKQSIDFDCSDAAMAPRRRGGDDWLHGQRLARTSEINYHAAEHAKELQRTAERNAWVKALRESLAAPSES